MYKNNDLDKLLTSAETLAQEVEELLSNKAQEPFTNLTLALNDFRMAQVQALQGIGEVLNELEALDNELVAEAEMLALKASDKKLH